MPSVRVTVNVEVDGEPIRGFPFVRRLEPADKSAFDITQAAAAAYVALPTSGVSPVSVLLFMPAADMELKLLGDGTGATISKGGLVLVVDAALTGTTFQNNSGGAAKVAGFVAGT
jgi:hypothetical protein